MENNNRKMTASDLFVKMFEVVKPEGATVNTDNKNNSVVVKNFSSCDMSIIDTILEVMDVNPRPRKEITIIPAPAKYGWDYDEHDKVEYTLVFSSNSMVRFAKLDSRYFSTIATDCLIQNELLSKLCRMLNIIEDTDPNFIKAITEQIGLRYVKLYECDKRRDALEHDGWFADGRNIFEDVYEDLNSNGGDK